MPLQATIQVPGLIQIAYPFDGQTITSLVRLAGQIFVRKDELPTGTQFIIDQLPPAQQAQVLTSHELNGKNYLLGTVTYYIDGVPYREVDFTEDEISVYQFANDYLPTFLNGEELEPGQHRFTVQAVFFSLENPGVDIFDQVDQNFIYDASSLSIRQYLDALAPLQLQDQPDHQIFLAMFDHILTQRTEGAVKADIDFLENLYDIDRLPDPMLPYLAKTVGHDYFAGILGTDRTVRQELRFLPEWQKSVGTENSILTLLRSFGLGGKVIPLYLDLINNVLVNGVNRYYESDETFFTTENIKTTRIHIPFIHDQDFLPNTVNLSAELPDGTRVFRIIWDISLDEPVIIQFDNSFGSPFTGWILDSDGSPDLTSPANAIIERILIDPSVGGATIYFNGTKVLPERMRWRIQYRYAINNRPGRHHRLSEFFDFKVEDRGLPNDVEVAEYLRVSNVVLKSKPFRTKLRQITFPYRSADAYHMNRYTVSSTGELTNLDRLSSNNIGRSSVNLRNPIRESVTQTLKNLLCDGFLFSWELDCDRFENRFGIFHSLAIDPDLHDEETLDCIRDNNLYQRSYAIIVGDDSVGNVPTDADKLSKLRQVGLRLDKFKGGDDRCRTAENEVVHYGTLQFEDPVSPAVQECRDQLIELDVAVPIDGSNPIRLMVDRVLDGSSRTGFEITWDGSGSWSRDDFGGASTAGTFDTDEPNKKVHTFSFGAGSYTLTLIRFTTQDELDDLLDDRSILCGYPFEVGGSPEPKWYAIWDISEDFYTNPVHLSVFYPSVVTNFQNNCCCEEIGFVDLETGSSLAWSEALGEPVYRFGMPTVRIFEEQTNREVGLYLWRGTWWDAIKSTDNLSVTLDDPYDPSIGWTDDISSGGLIESAVSPTPVPEGYRYRVVRCYEKVGDSFQLDLDVHLEDDFAKGRQHDGQFSPLDTSKTFHDMRIHPQDLFPHFHDKDFRAAAIDSAMYQPSGGSPSVVEIFPSVRYTLTPPLPLDQLRYDYAREYDDIYFYDSPPAGQKYIRIDHYPLNVFAYGVDNFTPGEVTAED